MLQTFLDMLKELNLMQDHLYKVNKKCLFCNDPISLENCNKFLRVLVQQKREFVREKRLCFVFNRILEKCFSKKDSVCGNWHRILLHVSSRKPNVLAAAVEMSHQKINNNSVEPISSTLTETCTPVLNSDVVNFGMTGKSN